MTIIASSIGGVYGVEIIPAGRWGWSIELVERGQPPADWLVITRGTWAAWTLRGAQRKAQRVLRRQLRRAWS